jgi:hypothetical protein
MGTSLKNHYLLLDNHVESVSRSGGGWIVGVGEYYEYTPSSALLCTYQK